MKRNSIDRRLFAVASAGVLGLAACASAPPAPADALQMADTAINKADEARAADYAPLDIKNARDKYNAARDSVQKAESDKDEDEMTKARWLAEEARIDAELATAKAQAAQAQGQNAEMQKNIDTLQHEMQRSSGG